uniref:Uncharacterized protein n=1 Tax=Romanomermis culicivorax TaxID=13658 RepID=A0A915HY90_ROMCU
EKNQEKKEKREKNFSNFVSRFKKSSSSKIGDFRSKNVSFLPKFSKSDGKFATLKFSAGKNSVNGEIFPTFDEQDLEFGFRLAVGSISAGVDGIWPPPMPKFPSRILPSWFFNGSYDSWSTLRHSWPPTSRFSVDDNLPPPRRFSAGNFSAVVAFFRRRRWNLDAVDALFHDLSFIFPPRIVRFLTAAGAFFRRRNFADAASVSVDVFLVVNFAKIVFKILGCEILSRNSELASINSYNLSFIPSTITKNVLLEFSPFPELEVIGSGISVVGGGTYVTTTSK